MKENLSDHRGGSRENIVFFGRIMANVSHEFNNIITVISELAGLLKDLSLLARKGRPIPNDKIESLSDNISKQVARGKHLVSHMNHFSHSADNAREEVDLDQVVENMQVLTDRLFKNRQTDLTVSNPSEGISLSTDPFELRRILFACLDQFLDASSHEVSVVIKRPENGENSELQVSGQVETIPPDFLDKLNALKEQAQAINGQLLYEKNETQILIRLILSSNRD
ncbi:MAG: HAMP domain-containing histidine kinase [Acidobacteria bacterium]|nr:HAMP domain-containing histidine kinase [Acidobacteriota bacterium]